jgi:membrane protease YdiL (CAAX protease family)
MLDFSLKPPAPSSVAASGASLPPTSGHPPVTDWPPWTAPAALVAGLVLAAVGSLLVDLPALAFGVNIISTHLPPGLTIADTTVQDGAFVLAAIVFAQMGGRTVRAWQFGLRPTRLRRAVKLIALTLGAFLLFSVVWGVIFHAEKEKLLEQLGVDQSTLLLLLSAGLTCVVAPVCEELLFRGFIFAALSNWKGPWLAATLTGLLFGGVHAGSAPVIDLVPLAALGFGLCMIYRYTGSLYPCIAAHSLNNSLAFGSLEGWGWQIPVLMLASLALIALLALALVRAGVISPEPSPSPATGGDASFAIASGGIGSVR